MLKKQILLFFHLNVNEVIANVAHLNQGGKLEDKKKIVHPNKKIGIMLRI